MLTSFLYKRYTISTINTWGIILPKKHHFGGKMFCPSCGKSIAEESVFCMHCGKPISTLSGQRPVPPQWEYYEFHLTWEKTYWIRCSKSSEAEARLDYWQSYQSVIMEKLQEYLDQGWQPLTEIGPAAIQLITKKTVVKTDLVRSVLGAPFTYGISLLMMRDWFFFMTGFYIKLRRPKIMSTPII